MPSPADPAAHRRLAASVAQDVVRRQLRAAEHRRGAGHPQEAAPTGRPAAGARAPRGGALGQEPAGDGTAAPAPLHRELAARIGDRLPPSVRALRLEPGRAAALGVALVAVLVAVALLVRAGLAWPDGAVGTPVGTPVGAAAPRAPGGAGAVPAAPGAGASAGAVSTTAPPAPTTAPRTGQATDPAMDWATDPATGPVVGAAATSTRLVVHVVGRVLRPGVVELPAGSRVADALSAAGGAGPEADLARLNLARVLADGEQVAVPAAGEVLPAAAAPAAAGPSPAPGSGAPVDLNTATEADLDALPGVGPVLAARILAWRGEHGRFSDVAELGEVQGIGSTLLERLRPLVRA